MIIKDVCDTNLTIEGSTALNFLEAIKKEGHPLSYCKGDEISEKAIVWAVRLATRI